MKVDARLAAVALIILTACAPIRLPDTRGLTSDRVLVEERSRAADRASAAFRRAWAAGDSAELRRLVAPDFTLVLANDSLKGERATSYLLSMASSGDRSVTHVAGKSDVCLEDGVLELNSEVFGLPAEESVTSGRYSISWRAALPEPRAERMVLRYGPGSVRAAGACASEAKHAALRHRLALTVVTGSGSLGPATTAVQVANTLRRDGYTFAIPKSFPAELYGYGYANSPPPPKAGPGSRPFPQIGAGGAAIAIGLRYLLNEQNGLELQVAAHPGETATGFHNTCSAPPCDNRYFARHPYVEVSSAPVSVSLLAERRVGWLRLGVGPALLMSNWNVYDDERNMHYVASGNSSWVEEYRTDPHESKSLSPALGAKGDIAILYPFTRYVVFEARASAVYAAKSTVPSTPRFAGSSAWSQILGVGGGLSISWR